MKKIIVLVSIISCFCVMLLSCSSLITVKDPSTPMPEPQYTTPIITSQTTTAITTPSWSIQTGNPVINSHSGYVMTNIYEKNITNSKNETLVSVKIISPLVVLYDNDSLQTSVNSNLGIVFNQIEEKVNSVCNRYLNSDPGSFMSLPSVFVDFSLEHFTKEAMSIKFQITENDENANIYKSYSCYNLDLTTGSIINCTTVFQQSDITAISNKISQKLIDLGYTLYPNSKNLIKQYFQECWFISYDKLNLCFEAGKIAAASEGNINLSFDIKDISSMLSQYGIAIITVNNENN